jgi:hypothetical protein
LLSVENDLGSRLSFFLFLDLNVTCQKSWKRKGFNVPAEHEGLRNLPAIHRNISSQFMEGAIRMNRNNRLLLIVLALVAVSFGACTIAKLSGRGALPILLNNPHAKVEIIKHVEDSKMVVFDYTSAFDASEILAKRFEETKADAIINVTFTVKSDVATFFINVFTLLLANARIIEVEGDLVNAPQGLGSLSLPGSEIIAEAENLRDLRLRIGDGLLTPSIATMIMKTQSGFALVHYQSDQFEPY